MSYEIELRHKVFEDSYELHKMHGIRSETAGIYTSFYRKALIKMKRFNTKLVTLLLVVSCGCDDFDDSCSEDKYLSLFQKCMDNASACRQYIECSPDGVCNAFLYNPWVIPTPWSNKTCWIAVDVSKETLELRFDDRTVLKRETNKHDRDLWLVMSRHNMNAAPDTKD